MAGDFHTPVLANETVELLVWDPSGVYVDCTVGGGGHSHLIIDRLDPQGTLIGIDRDRDAIEQARRVLPDRVALHHGSFADLLARIAEDRKGGIHGILMDLGVSSFQLDEPQRGFSYREPGPLDLRMDPSRGQSAGELLRQMSLDELTAAIRDLGEDNQARRIARAIVSARGRRPIRTTEDLAGAIRECVPATQHKSLPRVFQALRILVNDELSELDHGLEQAWSLLTNGGRLAVISYHSLEDRRVKQFFRDRTQPADSPRLPIAIDTPPPEGRRLTGKPLRPSASEISRNPRARSARLRAIEKAISQG